MLFQSNIKNLKLKNNLYITRISPTQTQKQLSNTSKHSKILQSVSTDDFFFLIFPFLSSYLLVLSYSTGNTSPLGFLSIQIDLF